MSEENRMTEENKKTIIAFVAGLLVGGLLVFIFVEPSSSVITTDNDREEETANEDVETETRPDVTEEEEPDEEEPTPVTEPEDEGNGSVSVSNQEAGSRVYFSNASFPAAEGWVGVREYQNGQLSGLLGASRWDKAEGLEPTSVGLLRPTISGRTYAVVFYTENGDEIFSLATDRQMQGVMETFEAE